MGRSRSRSTSPKRSRRRDHSDSRTPSPTPGKRLHVANIDESVRKRDIEDTFGKFGKLADIWVASYPPFYAFVVYERTEDATTALKEMKNGYVRDCHVRCSIALPRNSGGRGGPPPRRFSDYRRTPPRYERRRSRSPRRRSRSPRRRRYSSGSR